MYFFNIAGQEWDAIHLYIANNIDWMIVWIERCQQNGCSLTWEGVASLVIEAHRNGEDDFNVMPMVIDLEYGLRGREVCTNLLMIMTHMFHIKLGCK